MNSVDLQNHFINGDRKSKSPNLKQKITIREYPSR